jgi:hypothetical protein
MALKRTKVGYRIDPPLQTKRSSRIRKSEGIVDRVGLHLNVDDSKACDMGFVLEEPIVVSCSKQTSIRGFVNFGSHRVNCLDFQ